MKKYVISVEWQGQKKYVSINLSDGSSTAVEDIAAASCLPNRTVAYAVLRTLRPVVEKTCPDVILSVETWE